MDWTPVIHQDNTGNPTREHHLYTGHTPEAHHLHTGFPLALISLPDGAVYLGFEVCTCAHEVIHGLLPCRWLAPSSPEAPPELKPVPAIRQRVGYGAAMPMIAGKTPGQSRPAPGWRCLPDVCPRRASSGAHALPGFLSDRFAACVCARTSSRPRGWGPVVSGQACWLHWRRAARRLHPDADDLGEGFSHGAPV